MDGNAAATLACQLMGISPTAFDGRTGRSGTVARGLIPCNIQLHKFALDDDERIEFALRTIEVLKEEFGVLSLMRTHDMISRVSQLCIACAEGEEIYKFCRSIGHESLRVVLLHRRVPW